MKKVIILLVALFAAVTLSNAQLYVSGGVGIHSDGGKYISGGDTKNFPSVLTLNISPQVGFFLSNDFLVGLEIDFARLSTKDPDDVNNKASATGFGIGPFVRARMLEAGGFGFWMEGAFQFGVVNAKFTSGGDTRNADKYTGIGLHAMPVLSYDFSSSLSVELSCDFLRLYFDSGTWTDADDVNNKIKNNSFGLGLNHSTAVEGVRNHPDFYGVGSLSSPLTVSISFKF